MSRQIQIPNSNQKEVQFAVQNNDDVLLSHCRNKRPKRGVVTFYGLEWENFEDLKKDAETVCHYFYQLLIINVNGKIVAPSHADEIYNARINPYTGEKLS